MAARLQKAEVTSTAVTWRLRSALKISTARLSVMRSSDSVNKPHVLGTETGDFAGKRSVGNFHCSGILLRISSRLWFATSCQPSAVVETISSKKKLGFLEYGLLPREEELHMQEQASMLGKARNLDPRRSRFKGVTIKIISWLGFFGSHLS